jgi:hypothetical protein
MYGKLLMMIDSQSGLFVMAASTSLYSYIARNLSYDWIDLHLKRIRASQEAICVF